jgi:hypothetical protein
MPASIPWWGWLLVAAVCWFIQKIMRIRTDEESIGARAIRIALLAGMMLSALIGVIRFFRQMGLG